MQPWGLRVLYLSDPAGVLWHITRMFGNVKRLQQEPERTHLKRCNLVVTPINSETEIGIELARQLRVFGGYKCFEVGYGSGQHGKSILPVTWI